MKRSFDLELKTLYHGGLALFGCWTLQILLGITVRNPLTVVFFAFLFWAANKAPKGGKVRFVSAVLLTFLFAFLTRNNVFGAFESSLFRSLSKLIVFVGVFCLSYILIGLIYSLFAANKIDAIVERPAIEPMDKKEPYKGAGFVLTVALICLIFWLPYFLYEFPGVMTADSLVQFAEIIGDEPWSNHHPVLHTLLLWGLYDLGLAVSGDSEVGIAFYTVFQMVFMAFCCGILTNHLNSRRRQILAVAFYTLVPFNAVYVVTIWKDIIYAGIAMLLVCLVIDMRKEENTDKKVYWCLFVVLSILFSLFRSNAWIAFILWAVVFVIAFRKKLLTSVSAVAVVIACVVLIKGPVFNAFGVASPDFVESLSVPAQQISRVLVDDVSIDDLDKELIERVIDTTYIKELYAPDFADNIKELIRAGQPAILEENKILYFKLWLKLCIQHPYEYVRAWYDQVGGYIYPDVSVRVADLDGIMQNSYNLYWNPIIGGKVVVKLKEIAIKLGDFVPIYGMLWSIGAYFWLLVISTFVCLVRKENVLCKTLFLLLVFTLLLAAPVVDFRYGYAYVMTMPLWAVMGNNSHGTLGG